jgi:CopG family nickel-responsive transcriptional regulator
MAKLVRFGVSLEKDLLDRFDEHIAKKGYPTRSKAIKDLIREELLGREWLEADHVAGTITLVFDHHKRDLVNTMTDIQHHYHRLIISSQHIHLDHAQCLEVVIVRGNPIEIQKLGNELGTLKGMIMANMEMATSQIMSQINHQEDPHGEHHDH